VLESDSKWIEVDSFHSIRKDVENVLECIWIIEDYEIVIQDDCSWIG